MAMSSFRSVDPAVRGGRKADLTSSSRIRPDPGVWPTRNKERLWTKICSWMSWASAVLGVSTERAIATHANSPLRPSSFTCNAANSSGVTDELRSHSKVSVRHCVPTMIST